MRNLQRCQQTDSHNVVYGGVTGFGREHCHGIVKIIKICRKLRIEFLIILSFHPGAWELNGVCAGTGKNQPMGAVSLYIQKFQCQEIFLVRYAA